jgi:CPA1 family monovalent cation:H+ antiporter
VFLITGLQVRALLSEISHSTLHDLAVVTAAVTAVVIVARFLWVFPVTYGQRWIIGLFGRARPQTKWQWSFVIAFTGVRGIVSLAAALALPLTTQGGEPFPQRDLIIFLTFAIIIVTLIGQGLMLPFVVRVLGLENAGRRERHEDALEELKARHTGIEAALACLDKIEAERPIPEEILKPMRAHLRERLRSVEGRDGEPHEKKAVALADEIQFRLIAAERKSINQLYRDGKLKDEARRRIERELDLRHAHLTNQQKEV